MTNWFIAIQNIHPSDIDDEEVKKELNRCANALDELVAIGTHLLKETLQDESLPVDEKGIIVVFFKRILECLDAMSLLIRVGSITPALDQGSNLELD